MIVCDRQNNKLVLYCDGKMVGKPVDCAGNIGNVIMMYANNMDWQLDDLRVYTDKNWDGYSQLRTDVQTSLTWDDLDNMIGIRPASVTVSLLADGKATGKTAVLNAGNQWSATFADLPEYNAGKKVVYTVSASVTGYFASYQGNAITMQVDLSTKKVDQTVTVVWEDMNDLEHIRPDEITLQLYADGVAVAGKTLVVKASGGWTATFADLPQYNTQTRQPYTYTVGTGKIPGYVAVYQPGTLTMIMGLNFQSSLENGAGMSAIPD